MPCYLHVLVNVLLKISESLKKYSRIFKLGFYFMIIKTHDHGKKFEKIKILNFILLLSCIFVMNILPYFEKHGVMNIINV